MNFELIKDLLDNSALKKYKDFDQLSEGEQLEIFLEVRKEIVLKVRGAVWDIENHEDAIRELENDIEKLEETEKPIAEEIQKAKIRLGIIPVPGQLPLFEVAA